MDCHSSLQSFLGGVIGARFVIEGVAHQRVAQLTGLLVLAVGIRIFVGVDILYTRVTEKISCSLTSRPLN